MSRHTTFSFTLVPSEEQEHALRRHVGAARFAFNHCLRLVLNALEAKRQAGKNAEYPSTRRCARCGVVGEALSLSERIFRCSSCGHEADRDTNAAACLAQYPRVADVPADTASGTGPHVAVKQAETQNVCGEDSAGARSVWSVRETVLMKQKGPRSNAREGRCCTKLPTRCSPKCCTLRVEFGGPAAAF